MLHNRVLMAKFDPQWSITPGIPHCDCGEPMHKGDLIAMYPLSAENWQVREAICMTCHFWITHDSLEELGR